MPKNPTAWSAWNFTETMNNQVCVTYWLNLLQDISDKGLPFLVTLNPPRTPKLALLKWPIGRPFPSVAASKASSELRLIQGKRNIWFSGAYQGYGFHENGVKAGIRAANGLLRKRCDIVNNHHKRMVVSWPEAAARLIVTKFLKGFISSGCLILLEDGGTTLAFEGTTRKSLLKVSLSIHSPQFYCKVATKGDIGLAEAYIDGDFSLVDSNEGLVNLFMLFATNKDLASVSAVLTDESGRWAPKLVSSLTASSRFFFKEDWRQSRASRSNLLHYDLGNELFALFLDETMSFSCAIYETQVEDLMIAQLRKIHALIEKARIGKDHHVLEIGCGWGSIGIEAVSRTGCMYTGITLSKKQLEYARKKAKEAGLQDRIKFLLCDHWELLNGEKYDRIISCETIEAKRHESMEEYFRCCESLLAEDGLLVLQFISIQDQMYKRTSDFIEHYFFPSTYLPSLARITSAVASTSKLSVLHLEDIGIHYYRTLKTWRENFLRNKSKIFSLGFDEKFIRTWEYYYDYIAAGIKSTSFKDYQVCPIYM
ncbi:(S)-coclaurine N-methyltransferase [Dorcoceras hygrometricum]|uniref:(S)-coclaurine N-methyltransferase n=1 Tax=Dorcoceras hygrometricum TaxID=472368 RepID=A0A2Z7DBC9_9LAMI|nr:(S)-coclaurine N-methyltransferase [Dorcoceras hygrometricum]